MPARVPEVRPEALLLTSAQVADMLAISTRTLFRLVAARKVPQPLRFNRKLVRWDRAQVEAVVASFMTPILPPE